MSLAYKQLSIVQSLEPRTAIYNPRSYLAFRGGEQSSWKPIAATSYSDSSIQFSVNPPNSNILVDRKVLLNMEFTITLDNTNVRTGTQPLLYTVGQEAPRAHPINAIITTSQATINDTSISINLNDVIDPLYHYSSDVKRREIDDSLSPCMLDQAQAYNLLSGGIRNPLATYASSASGADTPRGAFNYSVNNGVGTGVVGGQAAVIVVNCTDYLYLSPFLSDQDEQAAFLQIQTLEMNLTLDSLLRVWSRSSLAAPITNISVTISQQPYLLFNYITPNPLMEIPKSVVYPFYTVNRYVTKCGNVGPGLPFSQTTQNIQLKSIPNRMYIYARRRNQDRTYLTSDVYAGITDLSINWNNQNGLLSSASQMDLFHMSQVNGLQNSWTQFSEQVGSPICVVFGRDICLRANELPGMLGTYMLDMNVTFTNLNLAETINYDLYVATIQEGTFYLGENRAVSNIGVLSQEDALRTLNAPMVKYTDLINVRGASFWSGVKNFFGDVGRGIKTAYDTVAPIVKEAIPYVKQGFEAAKMLGLGNYSGGDYSGGANSWTKFLTKHKGSDMTLAQKRKEYYIQEGKTPPKKKKKATKSTCAKKKKCPKGKNKKCVKKAGYVYQGGELIDRDMMQQMMY